jgi:predicted DNA-binding transcriptional regulator AlpA
MEAVVVKKSEPVITVGDLVDTGEVADLLGIAPESVTRYRARGGFPEPLRHFGGSPVWTRAQIAAFIESRPGRGAGGGRPRKEPAPVDTAAAPAKAARKRSA